MIYKDYKLTKFRCDSRDLELIRDAFHQSVDEALKKNLSNDESISLIKDLFHLTAFHLLCANTRSSEKFDISQVS